MESKTHISVKNLTVWYGQHQALNDITIDMTSLIKRLQR